MNKRNVYLYLIKLSNKKEAFYKIGISVNKYSRFYQIMKFGYSCNIEYMMFGKNYLELLELEGKLHNIFSEKSYTPFVKFGGYTECYSNIDEKEYIKVLRELHPFQCEVIKNQQISWR